VFWKKRPKIAENFPERKKDCLVHCIFGSARRELEVKHQVHSTRFVFDVGVASKFKKSSLNEAQVGKKISGIFF